MLKRRALVSKCWAYAIVAAIVLFASSTQTAGPAALAVEMRPQGQTIEGSGNEVSVSATEEQSSVGAAAGGEQPDDGGSGNVAGVASEGPGCSNGVLIVTATGVVTADLPACVLLATGGTGPTMSPAQAAQIATASFQLLPIDLGMAPPVNAELGHRRTYVGIPNWMWSASQTPLNWGPYSATAAVGGHSITATAQVDSVEWSMGDGGRVVCGAGTPYVSAYELTASPSCGYTYATTSLAEPGGRFAITAMSHWRVDWQTHTGARGVIHLDVSTSTDIEVLELQSVNI